MGAPAPSFVFKINFDAHSFKEIALIIDQKNPPKFRIRSSKNDQNNAISYIAASTIKWVFFFSFVIKINFDAYSFRDIALIID